MGLFSSSETLTLDRQPVPLLRMKYFEGVLLCSCSANGGERMAGGMDLVEVRRSLQPPEVVRHLLTGRSD